MVDVFLKILNMSIAAGWVVLAVVLLRLALKKAPKAIICVLWGLVALRLICPVSFESVLSLIPSAETVPSEIVYADTPAIHTGLYAVNSMVNPILSEYLAPDPPSPSSVRADTPMQILTFWAAVVWIVGMIGMLIYAVISYVRVWRRVRTSIPFRGIIRLCDDLSTPFILGIFRPHIYLPSHMDRGEQAYVIAHEQAHLKRRDHWWKPLGFALLTVYWFNPLLWVAYVLLCRDIEVACDEKVVKDMGVEDKKAYTTALLNCSVPRRMIAACPLAFGEVGVKGRIKNILNYKRPAFWIVLAAVAACIVTAVCFLTDPLTGANEAINGYTYRVKTYYYAFDTNVEKLNTEERLDDRTYAITKTSQVFQTQYGVCEDFGFLVEDAEMTQQLYKELTYAIPPKYQRIGAANLWLAEGTPYNDNGDTLLLLIAVMNDRDVIGALFGNSQGEQDLRYTFKLEKDGRYIPKEQDLYLSRYDSLSFRVSDSQDETLCTTAANQVLLNNEDERHLPIHKFTSKEQWDIFISQINGYPFPEEQDEYLLTAYDEVFFEDHTLFTVFLTSGSGSYRYGVHSVYCDGQTFRVNVIQTNNPSIGTCDMAGWLLTVVLKNEYVEQVTALDAVYQGYRPVLTDDIGAFFSRAYEYSDYTYTAVKPTLLLSSFEEARGYFRFNYCPFYADIATGRYRIDGDELILTDDISGTWIFKIHGDTLVFDAQNSSALVSFSSDSRTQLPDGAVFSLLSDEPCWTYGNAYGNIDNDSQAEYCCLGLGPTSGLFTFTLTACDQNGVEYQTIFNTEFYYLSFARDEEGNLLVRGEKPGEEPEIHYFNISVEDGELVLSENGTRLATWG